MPEPILTYKTDQFSISLDLQGNQEYTKVSYPVKYGIFSRLETRDRILEFNLNHEITHARSKTRDWLHPSEWLKRTRGNDWIYYSSGGYAGVFEAIGEYYLPNFMYPTNSLLGGHPFEFPVIADLCRSWQNTLSGLPDALPDMPDPISEWIKKAGSNDMTVLEKKADRLFDISGARATVLPPDARHCDYNLIPLTIADGCLYKCRFCKVKNKKPFTERSRTDIQRQLRELKLLYGPDLINYNALFLGEHDTLNASKDLILFAAQQAYDTLGFEHSFMKQPRIFLFGSVDSLLNADMTLFEALNRLHFETHINIGLESHDPATLERIGKPVTAEKVGRAFDRMGKINHAFANIEMTGNFIMDDDLPSTHIPSMLALVRDRFSRPVPKGSIYLSPLQFGKPSRELLYDFYRLKTASRLPMFLYIIQRL
ncbi:MAG: radical SAM protein [Desulfotignum sp.]